MAADPHAGWRLSAGDAPGEWHLTDPADPLRVLYAYGCGPGAAGARRFGCTGAAAHSSPWISPLLRGRAREYAEERADGLRACQVQTICAAFQAAWARGMSAARGS